MAWSDLKNFKSFHDELDDAMAETDGMVQKGLVKRISIDQIKQYFDEPRISRLGLIIKVKDSGQKKRRIVGTSLHRAARAHVPRTRWFVRGQGS